jgi:hypothetical protein
MKVGLVTIAALATVFVVLGPGTSAHASSTVDFSFFDNTGGEGPSEGVQCTALKSFAYQVSVSQWAPTPNVVRITLTRAIETANDTPVMWTPRRADLWW